MKNKKLSKTEVISEIDLIFSRSNPSPKEIIKAKKLASSRNIKLGEKKKMFCKKCNSYFSPNNSEIKIKMPLKIIKCKSCGYVSRHRI